MPHTEDNISYTSQSMSALQPSARILQYITPHSGMPKAMASLQLFILHSQSLSSCTLAIKGYVLPLGALHGYTAVIPSVVDSRETVLEDHQRLFHRMKGERGLANPLLIYNKAQYHKISECWG